MAAPGAAERRAVRADPDYAPTPLLARPAAADRLGLAAVLVKHEGRRLAGEGLSAFKALGVMAALGSVAAAAARGGGPVRRLVCASDGNYGRAVAWAARRAGLGAQVFLPSAVSPARAEAIRAFGAQVVIVPGTYDEAVAAAARAGAEPGALELSDTGRPGAEKIPRAVSRGYGVIAEEILADWPERLAPPSHVFLPVGVGSLAAGVVEALRARLGPAAPRIVAVEPRGADCLRESLAAGRMVSLSGGMETVMLGLACQTLSSCAWPVLRAGVDDALAVPDATALAALRELAKGRGDPPLVAGETGAAAYGALVAAARDGALRAALGLGPGSCAVALVCEGATDPDRWCSFAGSGAEAAASAPEGCPAEGAGRMGF